MAWWNVGPTEYFCCHEDYCVFLCVKNNTEMTNGHSPCTYVFFLQWILFRLSWGDAPNPQKPSTFPKWFGNWILFHTWSDALCTHTHTHARTTRRFRRYWMAKRTSMTKHEGENVRSACLCVCCAWRAICWLSCWTNPSAVNRHCYGHRYYTQIDTVTTIQNIDNT